MNKLKVKQVVFLSGKGGTGKTTISSAVFRNNKNRISLDCDVDAANLYILLNPKEKSSYDFIGGKKALINKELCSECGLCESLCRFNAIENNEVNQLACEGCGFCYRACPEKAIEFKDNVSGQYFISKIEDETDFLYARLLPGEGNSGKLVSKLKGELSEFSDSEKELVIIDGPPGIGCPVNASLSGIDFAVIVTEPTLSGVHDMKRLVDLIKSFRIKMGIVINKYDLNNQLTVEIIEYSVKQGIPVVGKIPYSTEIAKSTIRKTTINNIDGDIGEEIIEIEKNILKNVN